MMLKMPQSRHVPTQPPPGGYIKAIVFDAPIPEQKTVRHTKVADPTLIGKLAWLGNNVNQISRILNESKSISQTEGASFFVAPAIIAEDRGCALSILIRWVHSSLPPKAVRVFPSIRLHYPSCY